MREIVTVASSLGGRCKLGVVTETVDLSVNVKEGALEGCGDGGGRYGKRVPAGAENAQIDFGVEEGDVQAVGRDGVACRAGDAVDQSRQSQAAQIVGHSARGVGAGVESQQGGDLRAEVAVAESVGQVSEAA